VYEAGVLNFLLLRKDPEELAMFWSGFQLVGLHPKTFLFLVYVVERFVTTQI
jgi:hypothetical protein